MSNLIIFYGAPASGKLTIAKKVNEVISGTLVHNHMTYNEIIKSTDIEFGSKILTQKNAEMRLSILKVLFERGDRNVLLTFCYEPNFDKNFIEQLQYLCQQYSVSIYPVLLYADKETLLNRVVSADRAQFNKIQNKAELEISLNKYDYVANFPLGLKLTKLNTSKLSPQIACSKILEVLI